MNTYSFRKDLLAVQEELLRFAYKLTADREEAPQDSGFASTEGAYDLKEMHRIVNALPRDYKVPFSMHVSGFKYREIAERLGLPLGTVKSRIFFTRQKLQDELKDFI